jgi:hypothetical protein
MPKVVSSSLAMTIKLCSGSSHHARRQRKLASGGNFNRRERAMSRTRIALRSCQASLVLGAFALALVLGPKSAPAETLAAWVQLVGPARDASIRVITDDARCPTL